MSLRVPVNYLYTQCLCVEPQRNQPLDYCSSQMVDSYVISDRTLESIMGHQFPYKEDIIL